MSISKTLTEKNHAINCNYFNYFICPSSRRILLIHYYMYLLTVKIQRILKVTKDNILYHHIIIWLLYFHYSYHQTQSISQGNFQIKDKNTYPIV